MNVNQVLYAKVWLIYESAYADVFRAWFHEHPNTVAYINMDEAFDALERGEIDLLVTSKCLLLRVTNHNGKARLLGKPYVRQDTRLLFKFNIKGKVLRSIVSTTQNLVDTEAITNRWTGKVFDYNSKLLRDSIPFMTCLDKCRNLCYLVTTI